MQPDESIFVELDKSNRTDVLGYTIIQIDKKGYYIKTDNDISWSVGWMDSWIACDWQKGDKIILSHSKKKEFLLINLNTTEAIYADKTVWK
ncbi:MAG: hypothetical protein KR126chlam6_00801 [Candidatus Anoxychlamydiales bacterium]|nr:hypothetical protein [Candidatus Anoxychlamydiales bacterium]